MWKWLGKILSFVLRSVLFTPRVSKENVLVQAIEGIGDGRVLEGVLGIRVVVTTKVISD